MTAIEPALAVKAFIIKQDSLLLIKRTDDNVHKPGIWEVPGGRLLPGEDPFEGLKREVNEETGIAIEVKNPMRVHHFTRQDGQKITLVTFLCTALSQEVTLSHEHTNSKWIKITDAKNAIISDFHGELDIYEKYFKGIE